jgi:hypothetical protein
MQSGDSIGQYFTALRSALTASKKRQPYGLYYLYIPDRIFICICVYRFTIEHTHSVCYTHLHYLPTQPKR